jgi:hypothetical protein
LNHVKQITVITSSGDIRIESMNSGENGRSGDINLTTGAAAGGASGSVSLVVGEAGTGGVVQISSVVQFTVTKCYEMLQNVMKCLYLQK